LSCLPRSPTTTVCGGVGSYNFVLRGRYGNSSRCACRVWHLGLLDHPGWRPCNDAAWGNIASHHAVGPTIPPSPIVTPFKINAPNPIQAPLQIRTGFGALILKGVTIGEGGIV